MTSIKDNELSYLNQIVCRINSLSKYISDRGLVINDVEDPKEIFAKVSDIKRLLGNNNNNLSFIACLFAKKYLLETAKHVFDYDVAEKHQGAKGLDIDIFPNTPEKRIIGEIKTTTPYHIEKNDLGASQRDSFRKDFKKLNSTDAAHKYFFVTDKNTYEIILKKYKKELDDDVEIVLLPT
jgi:hypothetical protein